MVGMRIGQLHLRYRLPAGMENAQAILDRAFSQVSGEVLEEALRDCGISVDGEILIRELDVTCRIAISGTEAQCAADWAEVLAEAIGRAIREGRAVRFASRRQALAAFAHAAIDGDSFHAWAWRRLGFCTHTGPGQEALIDALADEPSAIVPLLHLLATSGRLTDLRRRVPMVRWLRLVTRAWQAAGGDAFLPPIHPGHLSAKDGPSPMPSPLVLRILRHSAILRAVPLPAATAAAEESSQPGEEEAALAALALLEIQPAHVREQAAAAATLAELAARLSMGRLATPEGGSADATAVAVPARRVPSQQSDANPSPSPRFAAAPDADADPPPLLHARATGESLWGGVLFLLHLLEPLGFVIAATGEAPLAARPLPWVLHRLMLSLLPEMRDDDPAVLAFSGVAPDGTPPSAGNAPATAAESAALATWCGRIGGALLDRISAPDVPAEACLRAVCRRHASIAADPGWFDVTLRLDEVSIDVRRAGLDLDPGYMPWLGAVVRFLYG